MNRFAETIVAVYVCLLATFAAPAQTTQPTTAPTAQPTVKYLGCYKQRARDLKAWADRGINLVVLWEPENGAVTQSAWRAAARAAGLVYIDTYLSDDDATDPNLLGWSLTDSDEWNRARGPTNARQATAPLIAEAARLAALNKAKGTNKLIYANADGPGVTASMFEKPPYNGTKNNELAVLPSLTLRSVDWYPVISIPSTQPSEIARRPMYLPAQAAWRIRTWCDGIGAPPAQSMVIIEAAKGWNSPLSVTGDQMRETAKYLMGELPFPVPDANGKAVNFQGQVADIIVFWTANGQNGQGWNWLAFNGDQEAAIIGIAAKYRAKSDPISAMQQRIAALEQNDGARAAQIAAQTQQIQSLTQSLAKQQSDQADVAAWLNAVLKRPATIQPAKPQ